MCVEQKGGILRLSYYHLVDDFFFPEDFRESCIINVIRSDGKGIPDFFSTVVLTDEATDEAALLFNALKLLTLSQPWEN